MGNQKRILIRRADGIPQFVGVMMVAEGTAFPPVLPKVDCGTHIGDAYYVRTADHYVLYGSEFTRTETNPPTSEV